MTDYKTEIPSLDDHNKAFTEISFLLDIFSSTIDNIMGGATASIGRIAGREMASKLPIKLDETRVEDALNILKIKLKSCCDISFSQNENDIGMTIESCCIRNICVERNLQLGSELCKLFHFYLDGMVNEIISRPVQSVLKKTEDTCSLELIIQ